MKFSYFGETLDGFEHDHNSATFNERTVELAVARQWLAGLSGGGGLEVGNVLGHYGLAPARRIVDRFERTDGVENIDVFDIEGWFDWIVSISTVEHVRWDDDPRDASGARSAIDHLAGLLAAGGRMLITVPAGYHPSLDGELADGVGADRACTLVRSKNGWRQTKTLTFLPYAASTPWAESVWIGEWSK